MRNTSRTLRPWFGRPTTRISSPAATEPSEMIRRYAPGRSASVKRRMKSISSIRTPSRQQGTRGSATSSSVVPTSQRSPTSAPFTSIPSVVRFSPNCATGNDRPSSLSHHRKSSIAVGVLLDLEVPLDRSLWVGEEGPLGADRRTELLERVVVIGRDRDHLGVRHGDLRVERGELQMLLVLLRAVVAAREREDQRVLALQLAELAWGRCVIGQLVIGKGASGRDVRTHGRTPPSCGQPPATSCWPRRHRSHPSEEREAAPPAPVAADREARYAEVAWTSRARWRCSPAGHGSGRRWRRPSRSAAAGLRSRTV